MTPQQQQKLFAAALIVLELHDHGVIIINTSENKMAINMGEYALERLSDAIQSITGEKE